MSIYITYRLLHNRTSRTLGLTFGCKSLKAEEEVIVKMLLQFYWWPLTLLFCYQIVQAKTTPPKVELRNGSYYGLYNAEYHQDFFLGIPFAQPPVGDLRLQLPQSLNASWSKTRNATKYGHACYGYGEDTFIGGRNFVSEDCLTLNVVRPTGVVRPQGLPVAVWFYGGGW